MVSDFANDPEEGRKRIDDEIEFRYRLGYDYIDVCPFVYFGANFQMSPDSSLAWISESGSAIRSREDFEKHHWPDPEAIDYAQLEYAAARLPEGMMIIPRILGVFENINWLTGLEALSYFLVDDPSLVDELFEKVGGILLSVTEKLVQIERVGAFVLGDDLGFYSGTMLSPAHIRHYVFPWHKKIADTVHKRCLPFIFHSCGNVEEVMDDLIEWVNIDAKHSFQDKILPVEEAVARYGARIAILGGVDTDLLARGTEEEVRARVREIIEKCAPSGRYAIGTGSNIASYLKVNNYFSMLHEAHNAET